MEKIFTLIVVCLTAISTWAYDVEVDGIYYNLNSTDKTAEVTSERDCYWGEVYTYSGSVTISETIISDGVTYAVTRIGDYAFNYCAGLTSVTIPNSVTSIGEFAFICCSNLTSVAIPNSVTSIGKSAFCGCTGLTSVTISNSVTSIGNSAFAYCTSLTSVTIPNSVTSIENSAFAYCTSLTSVTIPNSVTSIGSEAFRGCTGLTSVAIPNSVTSIGGWAFNGCTGLTELIYNAKNATVSTYEGSLSFPQTLKDVVIGNEVETIPSYFVYGNTNITSITIPNSVTSIGKSAFGGCTGLTEFIYNAKNATVSTSTSSLSFPTTLKNVVIGDNVESIPSYFIYGNTNITSITIPNSVTNIGDAAFGGCIGLTSVTISNSVTSIGNSAFSNCTSLTSVTIPNSMTSIGRDAFSGCTGLSKVNISDLASWIKISFANYAANPLNNALHLYLNDEEIKDLVIPNSVTSIGYAAFYQCSGLTSVTIPNTVTSIGEGAFYGCSGLTSVSIGNSVMSIGYYAFYKCLGLTSVTIPNSVTSIENYAFSGCTGLTSVTIGNSVTGIGYYAFFGCTGLTSVTIGNSVTSIGNSAFSYCTNLREIHSNNTTPPTCGTDVLKNVKTANCKLYVPTGSKDDYAFATGWGDFVNIIEESVVDPTSEISKPTITFADNKLQIQSSTPGVTYSYRIKANDSTSSLVDSDTGIVDLTATYTITAYAKKDGKTSEAATATIPITGDGSGDVNGDGTVNIADVNSLVDKLLKKE